MRGWWSKAVWNFSKNSSNLVAGSFPKGLEYGKRLSAKDVLRTFKARSVLPSISLLEKATQKT